MRCQAEDYHDHNFDGVVSQISFPQNQLRGDKIFHVRLFLGSPWASQTDGSQHPPAPLPLHYPAPSQTSWPWGEPPGLTGKEVPPSGSQSFNIFNRGGRTRVRNKGNWAVGAGFWQSRKALPGKTDLIFFKAHQEIKMRFLFKTFGLDHLGGG